MNTKEQGPSERMAKVGGPVELLKYKHNIWLLRLLLISFCTSGLETQLANPKSNKRHDWPSQVRGSPS